MSTFLDEEDMGQFIDAVPDIFIEKKPTSDQVKDPDAPRPANQKPPPSIRRSQRLRSSSLVKALKTTLVLFLGLPPSVILIQNSPEIAHIPDSAASSIQPEDVSHMPSYELKGLSGFQEEQLKYVQMLDLVDEHNGDETEDLMWKPILVTDHKVVKNKGQRKLLVKVHWLLDGSSWVDAGALRLQDPFVIIDYVAKKHLSKLEDFKWVKQYLEDKKQMEQIRKAFQAKVSPRTPKFKFGVQVPKGVRNALELDKINGDTLWRDAINTELKQINDY